MKPAVAVDRQLRTNRSRTTVSFLALACVWLCCLLTVQIAHAQDWPRIALPKEVRTFDIGQQVTFNSLPMRLRGFVSHVKPDQLIELFRQSLGKPLVENTLGNKQILGRVQGEYYVSVQIEPAGNGSRGMTAVTHLKASYDSQEQTRAERERWLARLPSGSRLINQMESQDGAKLSKYTVFSNTQSQNFNRELLKNILLEDGLAFEREGSPSSDAAAKLPEGLSTSKTLFFKGQGKEALATIYRDNNGLTSVVLNVVTKIDSFR